MQFFIYFSEILNAKFYDADGEFVGYLRDIGMKLNEEIFPRAESFVIRRGFFRKQYSRVPVSDVLRQGRMYILKDDAAPLSFQTERVACEFSLCRQILDQQVLDMDDHKVVRVNDVHLLRVDQQMYLVHVDVSLKGLIRRLGWTKRVDALMRFVAPKSEYLREEDLVAWRNTHVLDAGRVKNVLRSEILRLKIAKMSSVALADIMKDLDVFEKSSLFKTFPIEVQRKVFTEMPPSEKLELIDQMSDKDASTLLETIPADEATDVLHRLSKERRMEIFRLMQSKTSKELRRLLDFSQDSAGGLMTMEYLSLGRDAKVKGAIQLIKDSVDSAANIFSIYVLDENRRLIGVTNLRRFINADPEKLLLTTCYPQNIFVRVEDGMEAIALLLEKYKLASIPVLNENDVIQGVITSDDVMEELITLAWKKYRHQI